MKRKVDVMLLGHRFTVRTEKDESYVHGLAAHVTRKVEEIRRQMRSASREEQILLVALHLVDELCEAQDRAADSRAEMRRRTQAMVHKITLALGEGRSSAPSVAPLVREDEDEQSFESESETDTEVALARS